MPIKANWRMIDIIHKFQYNVDILGVSVDIKQTLKSKKAAKIRTPCNQVPHLTQDTTWESDENTIKQHNQEPRGQPFPSR